MRNFLIQSTITIIFLIINSSTDDIKNSKTCPESHYFNSELNKCVLCSDSNCVSCYLNKDTEKCVKCKENFFVTGKGICGEKCSKNNIKHCKYCFNSINECIQCKSHCALKNNKCNCFELYILIFVCIFIAVVTIAIVLYCLSSGSLIYKMAKIHLNQMRIIVHNDNEIEEVDVYVSNNNNNKKLNVDEIKKIFNKNKIDFDNNINIENKLCEFCNKNICNVKFNCGCFCCFDCERELIKKGKICEKCKKFIDGIQQISCGICFQNKKEIANFNCHCSMIACKDCYIKWRKENNICPACRKNLIYKEE